MRMNRIRLSESQLHRVIKESVNKVLNELYIGGSQVDFSDWHIRRMMVTEDGYYEFEAVTDNNWYALRGTYDGNGNIDFNELLRGHSGYGRLIPITDKLQRWFDIYASQELIEKLDYWIKNDLYDEPNYDDN